MKHLRRSLAAVPLAAMILAGCSKLPKVGPIGGSAPASAPADSVGQATALLDRGDAKGARRLLARAAKRDPGNAAIRMLLESIDGDPVTLLGRTSFAYVARPGDTMRGLSERFLGTPLKFYKLARYNRITVPASLTAGQLLRIPGEAPRPKPAPQSPEKAEPARPEPSRPTETPKPKPEAPAVPAPAAPARNPALAAKLRGAGLAELTQGRVDRAVLLLRRAAALDPASPLIQRDLARAERIQGTVRAKR